MAKKQFKAESKKLLDLMINSIYTHKEIFLRELISNASDALDKLYYKSLEEETSGIKRKDFNIIITPDKKNRTLTIEDNGLGMTKEELESNLGTIAKSGSLAFKSEHGDKDDSASSKAKAIDIIGQFGVGFYSAFMVADKVTVISKSISSDTAYSWESKGSDGYVIQEADRESNGTEVILHIKDDSDDENYSHFLENYTIRSLVKKYSDYIRYPIMMPEETTNADDKETSKKELTTLNSMEPIWKRQKSKVKNEEYNEFYKSKFGDYDDPVKVIRTSVEGASNFTALMFIPAHTPFDYYTKDYEKGLELYSSGVMIMQKCKALLPDYFNFIKGIVDSQDLSLNISRETLQHDRQLMNIAKNLEKKIKRELENFLKNDREAYEKFFETFGRSLKFGLYDDFGMHKDIVQDLVLFYSSKEKKKVTFKEYISKMPEEQKDIYYAVGDSVDNIDILPQTEYIRSKGYEILYLTDEADEIILTTMHDYDGHSFKSVSAEDLSTDDSKEEKKSLKKAEDKNKKLLEKIKEILGDRVSEVKLSPRLTSSAVCLTSKGNVSLEMEKFINSMPDNQNVKASRVLEINPDHKILAKLNEAFELGDKGSEELKLYSELLYNQALLISGLPIENPVKFGESICDLILK